MWLKISAYSDLSPTGVCSLYLSVVGWLLVVPSRVYVFDLHFTDTVELLAGYPYFFSLATAWEKAKQEAKRGPLVARSPIPWFAVPGSKELHSYVDFFWKKFITLFSGSKFFFCAAARIDSRSRPSVESVESLRMVSYSSNPLTSTSSKVAKAPALSPSFTCAQSKNRTALSVIDNYFAILNI